MRVAVVWHTRTHRRDRKWLLRVSSGVKIWPLTKDMVSIGQSWPALTRGPLDEAEAKRMASALSVLGDPARLRLISILAAAPTGEICVGDLTEALGLSQPTASHHLKVLNDAGLVNREQRGRWVYFR